MAKIVAHALRTLRTRRNLSQVELARRAKVNKQTIFRLEAGTAKHRTTRKRIVENIAQVLRADPDVLTGKRPLPDTQDDGTPALELSKLNFGVSTMARNAMYLVSERYHVTYSDIVELAPFLFCWAAEASLRQRKERLQRAESALKELEEADSAMDHMGPSDFDDLRQKIEAEKTAIECHDIWGKGTDLAIDGQYPFDTPFAKFLEGLVRDIGEDANFDEYGWLDYPFYRVCQKQAIDLLGGDAELAQETLVGHIALHQMPKDLRDFGKTKERIEWARAKLEDFRRDLRTSSGIAIAKRKSP